MNDCLAGIGGAMAGAFGGPQMGAAVGGALGGLLGNAGALQGRGQHDPWYALQYAAALRALPAEYWDAQATRRLEEREALVTSFLTDRIGTWLQRSPGDETFGEWAHREEL